ncbi:FAD-dependent oxidoreductase [Kribbella jejuensis]|uniref:FAD dependent oxidoreductase n=1 Tax=Kribbella jejuensis TaxID=236068 RepID=A0A542ERT8_9ACTN|nr:FAD-dependent oxidoreductase [Kribbella jejuensis]TQJ18035.1 FAD dependent oxidoreductase [Kribbella jejuensis]
MTATFQLRREIPVEDGYDLVVAGGGPAGATAAICAARLGAKVLLIESTGCMGGMGTSGLVTAFDPVGNGEEMLVGGLMREIIFKLGERGSLKPRLEVQSHVKKYHAWTPFRVEGYKLLLDELTTQAGVEVRFFSRVIDAQADVGTGLVDGVVVANAEGYRFVKARTFIDATGDAILAKIVGVEVREAGRDSPNIMPATLPSLFTGIDWARSEFRPGAGMHQHDEYLFQAIADGHFSQPDKHLPGMSQVGDQIGYLNGGHLFNMNALKVKDLSDGAMLGRRLAHEYWRFFNKYVPGYENAELVITASLIGVRESRRIVGEYELNIDDYLARRKFPDQIALFNKFIDIHPHDTGDDEYERFRADAETQKRLGPGEAFGIPSGILVPRGWTNLWVAGRCASSDVEVHGSIRVQPAASMMGQAAGTAAVQSIQTGEPACDLNTATLVETLRSQGAHLPQPHLRPTMTRNREGSAH